MEQDTVAWTTQPYTTNATRVTGEHECRLSGRDTIWKYRVHANETLAIQDNTILMERVCTHFMVLCSFVIFKWESHEVGKILKSKKS